MRKIFICAPNRHGNRTKALAEKLEEEGFSVTFAAEHTKQYLAKDEIFRENMKLIKDSDIFLAYFVDDGHYGIDFASEVGIVSGMGRKVIGFVELQSERHDEFNARLEKDVMFKHSFSSFAWNFGDLLKLLK